MGTINRTAKGPNNNRNSVKMEIIAMVIKMGKRMATVRKKRRKLLTI